MHERLRSIYEEIMWLAQRPHVTPGRARSWYTHVMAETVKRKIRRFTGMVSHAAVVDDGPLILEHFQRIQAALSGLIERHHTSGLHEPDEFVQLVLQCEQVHIVTRAENYAALHAAGDYERAGITLIDWRSISLERQAVLWQKMLRGRVANARDFAPVMDTR